MMELDMNNSLFRFILISLIIVLFIGGSIQPVASFKINKSSDIILGMNHDIWIVDNEGDGDYTSLKEALNDSNPGDTIEIYSGKYYENKFRINTEAITIKGIPYEFENGNDTGVPQIIDITVQKGQFIFVRSDEVIIDGLAIIGNNTSDSYHVINFHHIENCILSNCLITHSGKGCCISFTSQNSSIINNTIINLNKCKGIAIGGSNNIITKNRVLAMNSYGIMVLGYNHNISGNIIENCNGKGVYLHHYYEDNIINENVIKNCEIGIDIADFEGGGNNYITGNELKNNRQGINIEVGIIPRGLAYIRFNNFINNTLQAFFFCILLNFFNFYGLFYRNYWSDWIGIGPKIILGAMMPLFNAYPMMSFDLFPAREPYDI